MGRKKKKRKKKKKRDPGRAAEASRDRMAQNAVMGETLSKLQSDGDVVREGNKYKLTEQGAAKSDDAALASAIPDDADKDESKPVVVHLDTPDGKVALHKKNSETLDEYRARVRVEMELLAEKYSDKDSVVTVSTDLTDEEEFPGSKALIKEDGKSMIVGPDGGIVPISEELANKLQTAGEYAKTEDFDLDIDPSELNLTDEEKVLWEKSPAAVVGMRVQQGDKKFIEFMAQVYEHREARKEQEDHTLDHYRHLQEMLARFDKKAKLKSAAAVLENRLVWSFLRQAKVFNIDRQVYGEIYRACDKYVNEVVVGDKWLPPPPVVDGRQVVPPMPEGHVDPNEYVRRVKDAATKCPVPDKYPFDIVYIGLGQGISLTMEQFLGKFSADEKTVADLARAGFSGATHIGALITSTGYVTEFYAVGRTGGRSAMYMLNMLRTPDDGWIPTYDLGPWYIPKVIEFINKNRTFVAEVEQDEEQKRRSKKTHRDTSKSKTKILWIPPPYYRLQIRDTLIEEKTRDLFENPPSGKTISYRHDVRGHERYFVRRGDLPLKDKDRAKLQTRGYTIYVHTQPSSDHMAGMLKRGLPRKRSDEWMAIKISWIDSHISPSNEELPYVPALRTTGKTG